MKTHKNTAIGNAIYATLFTIGFILNLLIFAAYDFDLGSKLLNNLYSIYIEGLLLWGVIYNFGVCLAETIFHFKEKEKN